jgi:hypothetical protein
MPFVIFCSYVREIQCWDAIIQAWRDSNLSSEGGSDARPNMLTDQVRSMLARFLLQERNQVEFSCWLYTKPRLSVGRCFIICLISCPITKLADKAGGSMIDRTIAYTNWHLVYAAPLLTLTVLCSSLHIAYCALGEGRGSWLIQRHS